MALLVSVVGVTLVGPATSARASGVGPWGVAPATTATNRSARPFFEYTQPAGGTIHDAISIVNLGGYPLTYDLYTADGYDLANGAFALRGATDTRTDVGAWTHLSVAVVSVPPHERAIVPFTVTVPLNATPGDHAGGIVALVRPIAAPAPGSQVETRQGVGARIYLRVPGALRPAISVTSVDVKSSTGAFGGGRARVDVRIGNTGNVRLDATAQVVVTDVFGNTVKSFPAVRYTGILPGASVALNETWSHLPFAGPYHVKVKLSASGQTNTGGAGLWVVPWAAVAIVALLLIALVAWRVRRRIMIRRTAGRIAAVADRPAVPSPTGAP